MLYIVRVKDEGEVYEYEYGNMIHAKEHYNNEKSAELVEYNNGNYYLVEVK